MLSSPYYHPVEVPENALSVDRFTSEVHDSNLERVEHLMAFSHVLIEARKKYEITPWLISGEGLIRARALKGYRNYRLDIIEQKNEPYFGLPPHTIKHTIDINKNSLRGKTKLFLPPSKNPGLIFFNKTLIDGQFVNYPGDIAHNPVYASKLIRNYLTSDPVKEIVRQEQLQTMFSLSGSLMKRLVRINTG